MLIRAK